MEKNITIDYRVKEFRYKMNLLYDLFESELLDEDEVPDNDERTALRLIRSMVDYVCDFEEDRLHDSARLENIESMLKDYSKLDARIESIDGKLSRIEEKLDELRLRH